jgi:hypothetical protein
VSESDSMHVRDVLCRRGIWMQNSGRDIDRWRGRGGRKGRRESLRGTEKRAAVGHEPTLLTARRI